jgi:L-lactate dehydrogenase (cytochrome)
MHSAILDGHNDLDYPFTEADPTMQRDKIAARRLADCHNVSDLRKLAKRKLPWPIFNYLDGGSDDEIALRRSVSAFDDYELLPTHLTDISEIDLKTTVLGTEIDWPVFLAPTGASRLFHHEKEPAVVRAAHKFGTIYSLSTLGTTTIEDVAKASPGPKMYQVYVFKDRGITRDFVQRCKESGYDAICLTVDTQIAGNRERDLVTGFGVPPKLNVRSVLSYLRHFPWTFRAIVNGGFDMVNVTSSPGVSKEINEGVMAYVNSQFDRTLNWKDVEWLASEWDGPLVLKGVQTVSDARKAVDAGVTALMLSNHGGRQLESAPAPVDCIAPIADALRDRLEIICDGGVRRGNHVVKALALGANACSIGRGYLFGLAAGGQQGVEHALGLLRAEVELTMALMGCNSVRRISREYVQRR